MSTAYATPLHQALYFALDELTIDEREPLERALVQLDGASSPMVVREALAACGVMVTDIDGFLVPRAVGPQTAVLGLGSDHHIVLSHDTGKLISETVITAGITTRQRRKRKRFLEGTDDRAFQWFAIANRANLSSMARPRIGMPAWSRLLALLAIEKKDITVVALYAAALGALTLVTPIAIQALVNTIAFGSLMQPLIVLTAALFVGLALAGTLTAAQAYVVEVLQRRILVRVAEEFAARLPRIAASTRDRTDVAERTNRFFDVITIQKTITELLLTGLALLLQTIVGMLLLGFYHPALLVFDVALVALAAAVAWLGRGATQTAIAESKAKFSLAAHLEELARVPESYRGREGGRLAANELSQHTMAYLRTRRAHYRHVFSVLLGGISLQIVSIVGVLAIGGWLVIERQLTLGQLVAAEIVVGAIAFGIAKFGRLADKAFDLVAATDKIGNVLDLPLRDAGRDRLQTNQTGLTVEAAGLRSGYAKIAVHSPLSLYLEPGSKTIVTGAAGSGRSALLETLAGLRDPVAGAIHWNGRAKPREEDMAAQVVLARSEVMATSILNNLRAKNSSLSSSEAWNALEVVGLLDVVDRLSGGLDCKLLPSGAPLSPSQVQRLALARVLVARPTFVLFDEVFDSIGDDRDLNTLLNVFLAPDAPWTAAVTTSDPRVEAFVPGRISIEGESDA